MAISNKICVLLFYCCERDTIKKATYRGNHLIGDLLVVSEGGPMTIMV